MPGWRRKVFYLVIAVIVGVAAGLVSVYKGRFHLVYIKIDPGTSASLYVAGKNGSTGKLLYGLDSSKNIKLKEGSYLVSLKDPDHMYRTDSSIIRVGPFTTNITIDQNYSDQKLASLLPGVRSLTNQALESSYPSSSAYSVSKDGLYQKGDWYGAVVVPVDPSQDTVRLILHKVNGSWVVAADPNIMIGKPSHPDIPSDVVESVDKL